jgi:hypothetical protein
MHAAAAAALGSGRTFSPSTALPHAATPGTAADARPARRVRAAAAAAQPVVRRHRRRHRLHARCILLRVEGVVHLRVRPGVKQSSSLSNAHTEWYRPVTTQRRRAEEKWEEEEEEDEEEDEEEEDEEQEEEQEAAGRRRRRRLRRRRRRRRRRRGRRKVRMCSGTLRTSSKPPPLLVPTSTESPNRFCTWRYLLTLAAARFLFVSSTTRLS